MNQTKLNFEKQLREYHQLQSPAATNPGGESGNPYLNDVPGPVSQEDVQAPPEMQAQNLEAVECIDITARTHWIVKSVTPVSRIFMIDVQSKGMFKV